jgi:hypothetical protein
MLKKKDDMDFRFGIYLKDAIKYRMGGKKELSAYYEGMAQCTADNLYPGEFGSKNFNLTAQLIDALFEEIFRDIYQRY